MKVADKITLLKSGVKLSEIAELEKEELLEKEQPENEDGNNEEDEQTSKHEEEEEAEKHSPELEEILKKVEALEAENKEMKDYIAKVNIGSKGSEEEEPKMKTGIDVMKELFGGGK